MPTSISPKVLAQVVTSVLTLVVGYFVTSQGIHLSPDVSATVTGAIATVAGALAGYLAPAVNSRIPTVEAALAKLVGDYENAYKALVDARKQLNAAPATAFPPVPPPPVPPAA